MILLLLIDLFFYNYTKISTCFFLLFFLEKRKSTFFLFVIGLLWDFFVLHTKGLFILLLILLYFVTFFIKCGNKKIIKFFVITICFLIYSFILWGNFKIYFIGVLLNLFIMLLCDKLLFKFIFFNR